MEEYSTADKYKMLKLNGYVFAAYGSTVTWGQEDCRGYVFGGKCESMDRAVEQAFEEWERGLVTDFVYLMGIGAEEAGRVVYWKCIAGDFG